MKNMMKKALSIVIAIAVLLVPMTAFAATGDIGDPYQVEAGGLLVVEEIAANGYAWFQATGDYIAGEVTVECDSTTEYTVTYCRQNVTSPFTLEDGADMFMVSNPTDSAISVAVSVSAGISVSGGTFDNPEILTFDEWYSASSSAALADDNMGYYWNVTAVRDGAIGVIVSAYDDEWMNLGWSFYVTNKTSGVANDTIWSDEVEMGYEDLVEVSAGDVLEIYASTYDPEAWANPAGNVYLTVNNYALGDYSYPATPVEGNNTATVVEGNPYYYEYVATEAGTATVTMNSAELWEFNLSKAPVDPDDYANYYYGDYNNYVDGPATESIELAAGETLTVEITTYDTENPYWSTLSADIDWTFSFEPGSSTVTGSGTYDDPTTAVVGDQTAPATSMGYYIYSYTATADGTATVTMNDATGWEYVTTVNDGQADAVYNPSHRYDNDPVVASESVDMYAGQTLTIAIAAVNELGEYLDADVNWNFDFVEGTIGGGNIDDGVNYEEFSNVLVEGDNTLPVSSTYDYTVYTFTPSETGTYTLTAGAGTTMGIVSYIDLWVQTDPADFASVVVEDTIVWECQAVGQSIKIAVKSDSDVANINLEREELGGSQGTIWEDYENTVTPGAFTMDGNKEDLVYVDFEDDVIDQAVLGDDGYYHLNDANGPILYANLNDTSMLSLLEAYSYGQLRAVFVDEETGDIYGIDFNDAFMEYYACSDEGYYPLTEDIAAMFILVGASQGWYDENGWIGDTEDAWMFACYYFEGEVNGGGDTGSGDAGAGDTGSGDTGAGDAGAGDVVIPNTDATSFAWAVAMMFALAAAYMTVVVRKTRRVK